MFKTLGTASRKYGLHVRYQTYTFQRFISISNEIMEVKSCKNLRNSSFPELLHSPLSTLFGLLWKSPLQNIYIVKKPRSERVRKAMIEFMYHIHHEYPAVNMIVSEDVAKEITEEKNVGRLREIHKDLKLKLTMYTGSFELIVNKTDLIVTLGGDGTILRAVGAFLNVNVPPVLSFALGTLGFLLPFDFKTFQDAFKMVYESRAQALYRSRLECHVFRKNPVSTAQTTGGAQIMKHALNDVSIHRGGQGNLASFDVFIDNEFLTTSTADGMVISTPTGSTAYSLSAGGSITHPLIPCLLMTPICPRSLSFRPLIIPSRSQIMIRLSDSNRCLSIKLNVDGVFQKDMEPGDELHVSSEDGGLSSLSSPSSSEEKSQILGVQKSTSRNGILCIARSQNDWTKDINELLGFNSSFKYMKRRF
ncbi:uncharacterized protein PRCAT00004661001 [Priceomyces carsonii]|uniref:uncharacterized protein n=1 Tax=Priceomyces carsonii TaxID=28549 RepID=UPI002ED9D7B1|nr:unnamed protein product [Priceomyces carsonii]